MIETNKIRQYADLIGIPLGDAQGFSHKDRDVVRTNFPLLESVVGSCIRLFEPEPNVEAIQRAYVEVQEWVKEVGGPHLVGSSQRETYLVSSKFKDFLEEQLRAMGYSAETTELLVQVQ
jgi:hypothetical protein